MKKIIMVIALLFAQFAVAKTKNNSTEGAGPWPIWYDLYDDDCDVCGCSASGGSMGYRSMLTENFVGLRYIYQAYTSKDGHYKNSPWIEENFETIQLWSRIPVTDNFQIMALVPYRFNSRVNAQKNEQISGIGDITVLGFYNLWETKNDSLAIQHQWQVGLGVKAPTGEYASDNNGSVNPSFQLGTGSWDYTMATSYTIEYKKFGLNSSVNYIVRTENEMGHKYGDQFNYGGTFFYIKKFNAVTLVPQLGIAGEIHASEEEFGYEVPKTTGEILFGKFGIEAGYKRFSIGVNAMLPISQDLNGGRVKADYRVGINLNYVL